MPELSPEIVNAIAYVIGILVALLGPKPLKRLYDLLGIEGPLAVVATYVASGIVAAVALGLAGAYSGVELTFAGIVQLSLLLAAAAQVAYHRLKDSGSL